VPPGGWPLVLALHGGGGSPAQFAAQSGLAQAALSAGFAIVFPEGTPTRVRGGTWNAGSCCGAAKPDDVAFLRAVVDAAGHSNGGGMSYRLACEAPDLVAGVAPVAGGVWLPRCAPPRGAAPVSVLHLHGLADDRVPLTGAPGSGGFVQSQRPPLEVLGEMAARAGCSAAARDSAAAPGVAAAEWGGCQGGARFRAVLLEGWGHAYPTTGVRQRRRVDGGHPPLDAASETIAFFRSLPPRRSAPRRRRGGAPLRRRLGIQRRVRRPATPSAPRASPSAAGRSGR